jgi:hypothetical protein
VASLDWPAEIEKVFSNQLNQDTLNKSKGALGALGAACQATVEESIGRTFDSPGVTEAYDGTDSSLLLLLRDPIVELVAVTVDGAPLRVGLATDSPKPQVFVHQNRQAICRPASCFPCGSQNVVVTYRAGLTSDEDQVPPADLVYATAYFAADLWKRQGRIGVTSTGALDSRVGYLQELPKHIQAMIDRHRRPLLPW